MTMADIDLIAGWASFVLTLMVFSYLIRDNLLYRLAVHILIGAAAAFVLIAALEEIIVPWLRNTFNPEDTDSVTTARIIGIMPVLIGILLVLKASPRLAGNPLTNLLTAFVIGVGTGVAVVGAVLGTILPLVTDTVNSVDDYQTGNALILVAGTVTTLAYFQYLSRRRPAEIEPKRRLPFRILNSVGLGFIVVTLGALYASVILTSLSIFTRVVNEQIRFIVDQIGG